MPVCYLGIGSNLGQRRKNIKLALQEISRLEETRIIKLSKLIKTKAIGGPAGQDKFLNAALKIKTNLAPFVLLKKLKAIEIKLGRPQRHIRYGPRSIDLDILFYGDMVIKRKDLEIPHPRVFARAFVIKPLLEVI
ncbi:MAG: 2-amino-4-hydroxy-6-hydroxymethyldihydropteridine diphosphokinase [Candidatus Omnitrophica bacterium]|nr:2-amino-4-hydroxy-6-hydroxymethyldihydropteridine diphosphokinase [Candidatus Omnitrophota bacterium]